MSSLDGHRVAFWASLSARERRMVAAMASAVAAVHVLGFVALLAFVARAPNTLSSRREWNRC
jgi:type II secretory pathway component PulM